MSSSRRLVLLAQLPIPPNGPQPIHGNVPLAAAYLKLFARNQGLEDRYAIEFLPPALANTLGDQGLVEAFLAREPWMVGFTCYLWNIERTLWIAGQLKQARPDLRIVLGGPEITGDNGWVLKHSAVDYAVIGEGEQTFSELLAALADGHCSSRSGSAASGISPRIPGLWCRQYPEPPAFRFPLKNLDAISSPYLEGILDAADEKMMFLETVRGCVFKCKFCYYPKSYDSLYFVSQEKVIANLQHAAERGAREVVLLDPTLNQRRDFADFLRLLTEHNPGRQFTYFGELRGEGINPQNAKLLKAANFSEVEIGLQSLDPRAQELMDRKVNLKALERGARAMLDAGINVRVDLILGLPGDTADSIRRGIEYLHNSGLYTAVQVFNLSVLPGTAFRQEAVALGLAYQARPPYYVLRTPTLTLEEMYQLMEEVQEAFGLEFDPFPPPVLEQRGQVHFSPPDSPPSPATLPAKNGPAPFVLAKIDLDRPPHVLPPSRQRVHAFTLWLRSADFEAHRHEAAALVTQVLAGGPHLTLQVVLEPVQSLERLTLRALEAIQEACYQSTSYLDLFYSMAPNRLLGAKRLVVVLPIEQRGRLGLDWVDGIGQYAAIVWRGGTVPEEDLASHEHVLE